MARTTWNPEVGPLPKNKGRNVEGPLGGGYTVPAQGSTGNPGTQLPWEGSDATPKPGELPPLKSL